MTDREKFLAQAKTYIGKDGNYVCNTRLHLGGIYDWCAYSVSAIMMDCEFIGKYIPRAHAVRSDATYLLWIDLGYAGRYPAKDIREKTGLFLSEGEIYGKGGEGFVRMNLACPVSQLEDGLARLKAWDETINDDIRL